MKISKTDFDVTPDLYEMCDGTTIGAEVRLDPDLVERQAKIKISALIDHFKRLIDVAGVVHFPDLTSIPISQSNENFNWFKNWITPNQRLHRDHSQSKSDLTENTAFWLHQKRSRFGTLYVPNEMYDRPEFPNEVRNLAKHSSLRDKNTAYGLHLDDILESKLGIIINRDPGLTIISNLSGRHARVLVDPEERDIRGSAIMHSYIKHRDPKFNPRWKKRTNY